MALYNLAWENGDINTDDPDQTDEVIDDYMDDMMGEFFAHIKDEYVKEWIAADGTRRRVHEKDKRKQKKTVKEGGKSQAQQAAIAISKKEKAGKPGYDKEGKSLKKETVMDSYRQMWEDAVEEETVSEGKEFKDKDIEIVAKFTDRNEHTLSLMHVAKVLGDRKAGKKLELIYKMHNEYGHMPSGLKSLRDEIFDDFKKQFKKYDNGDQMYGAL